MRLLACLHDTQRAATWLCGLEDDLITIAITMGMMLLISSACDRMIVSLDRYSRIPAPNHIITMNIKACRELVNIFRVSSWRTVQDRIVT